MASSAGPTTSLLLYPSILIIFSRSLLPRLRLSHMVVVAGECGSEYASSAESDSELEFRHSDDSWYSVRVVIHGDTLSVKYSSFSDPWDDRFHAGDFSSLEELNRFQHSFRPASLQLQDNQCSKVVPGSTVCASHVYNHDEVRFHDALVEHVEFKEHAFTNGEEECMCIFMLSWQHGPKVGTLTTTNIESICIIQSNSQIDPILASFLNIAMKNIQRTTLGTGSTLGRVFPLSKGGSCHEKICHSVVRNKSSLENGETNYVGQFRSTALTFEENISSSWMKREQDVDMGGGATSSQHFILLNNLEKDLSSRTVVEFIYNQTAMTTEAFIFPSLFSELCSRGIIVLDCRENFEKLHKFLDNPNHLIISSTGRPWVMSEKISRCGLLRMPTVNMTQNSEKKFRGTNVGGGRELKVACIGTQEYRKGKQLRDLFMEFADHQQRLHMRLALQEREILQMCRAA